MAITASQISVAPNPNDPNGTIVTFVRSDTQTQVSFPVPVTWSGTPQAEITEVKAAIKAWEAQANGIAAVNAAAAGQTI